MELMGMKACIVPPNPGNLSAFGLLAVDWRTDHIVTKVMHEETIDLSAVAAIYAALEHEATAIRERRHRARPIVLAARSRRALRRPVDGGARPAPSGAIDAVFLCGPGRRLSTPPTGDLRLQLCRPAESRDGQFLRVRLRHDRPAADSCVEQTGAPQRTSRPVYFDARFRDTPVFARPHCRRALSSKGPRSSRNSVRPPRSFPANT